MNWGLAALCRCVPTTRCWRPRLRLKQCVPGCRPTTRATTCCRSGSQSTSTRTPVPRPRWLRGTTFRHSPARTWWAIRGWLPRPPSHQRVLTPLLLARIFVWCTTARCPIRTAYGENLSHWASSSRPTTTPRRPAVSWSGVCAKAMAWRRRLKKALMSSTASIRS